MTTHDPIDDRHDTDAKLSLQRRQQLSALVDDDLAPEQARFLLRRLGHDAELASRWDRWHLIGDVLRGQPVVALPAGADGFAARVSAALVTEPAAAVPGRRARWQHGVGMALAASVAAVALFVARPLSVDGDLPAVVATGEATPVSTPASTPASPPPSTVESVREVSVPQFAEVAPSVAPTPQQASTRVRPQATPQRVASATVDPIDAVPDVLLPDAIPATVASAQTTVLAAQDVRPFASPREPQARPWPRAVLPGPAGDDLTVGLDDTAEAPSFYPFEPQLPVDTERTP